MERWNEKREEGPETGRWGNEKKKKTTSGDKKINRLMQPKVSPRWLDTQREK